MNSLPNIFCTKVSFSTDRINEGCQCFSTASDHTTSSQMVSLQDIGLLVIRTILSSNSSQLAGV